jgi:purine-binding chemotaxis protein CheW
LAERGLARRRGHGPPGSCAAREQLLLFRVGSETYGVGIQALWEVLLPEGVTDLPTPPYQLCTALAYRGRRLPLVRMSELFGAPAKSVPASARVVLIQSAAGAMGLLVDAVLGMLEVETRRLAPVPRLATQLDPRIFRGVFARDGAAVLVVSEDGLGALDEVARFAGG